MTRDGSSPSAGTPADPGTALGAQNMNLGGVIVRAVLSLAIVLAMAIGAIKFLKKRGYGVQPSDSAPETLPAQRQQFGMSPVARMLVQQRPKTTVANTGALAGKTLEPIGDLQVLGSQILPGTSHTLYKVRVGDRILLLGGTPSGSLNVLTEWDVETTPQTEQRFEDLLDEIERSQAGFEMDGASAPTAALHSATQRLNQAMRRVSSLGSKPESDSRS